MVLTMALLVSCMTGFSVTSVKAANTVTGLKQTDSSKNHVEISWNPILGVSRYDVQISEDGRNWVSLTWTGSNSDYIYDLASATTYYVRVSAYQANTWSAPLAVTTCCEKVADIRQTDATTSTVSISWDAVVGATSYQVCEFINSKEYVVGTTKGTSYILKGFENQTKFPYDICVKPLRDIGTGYVAGSAPLDYVWGATYISSYDIKLVPTKMNAPTISTYYTSSQSAWMDLAKKPFASGYQYEMYTIKGKKVQSGDIGNSDWKVLNGVKSTNVYKLRVRAYTYVGVGKTAPKYGAWSDWTYLLNGTATIKAKRIKKTVKLTWTKNKGAKSYTVYGSTNSKSGFKKIKTVKKNSLLVKKVKGKKLKKGKNYYFKVVTNTKIGKKTYKSKSDIVLQVRLY